MGSGRQENFRLSTLSTEGLIPVRALVTELTWGRFPQITQPVSGRWEPALFEIEISEQLENFISGVLIQECFRHDRD